ncbi:MAG: pyridoxal-phosphate dependent enzyme [Hyphomonadaceae bacterium]
MWANQFDNVANRQGHIDTTGPEIWRDTDGKVDGFICAVGSGGTLGGVSMALKAKNKGVVIGIADRAWRRTLQLVQERRVEGRRHINHRRHWPRPHHRKPRRRGGRRSVPR